MLLSMTGFGKATGSFQGKKVTVEVRSLNSKTLDLNVRIASNYRELEPQIRNIISAELDRGKIDVNINIDSTGDTKNFSINKDLAKAYFQDLKDVNSLIGGSTEDYLSLILRMPEIYNNEREELGDEEKAWLLSLCQDACASLNEFRRQEGLALENEFNQRIGEIKSLLEQVPKYEQERIEIVRSRIKKGLEELQNIQFDTNRLEQEMIFYIEKLDVSEEKMRLSNHLDYYLETMILPKSGKKLGFISQEIGREINTLGSKSNQADMQKLVVDMKDSLEKIKEQILNTL
ncbi:MAG: YicC/YloC family endoribonuclease [Flavobacteriia bacterium]|jgi:uncharacterized protein (TIGR00255 family)